jgi:apolipoprotein D and lipocalin family protein
MSTRTSFLLFASSLFAAISASAGDAPLATVPHVDLPRYLGRWYEIARYPNRFEKQCDRDVTATYSLRPDGRITVLNACIMQDGRRNEAQGWARIADPATNAKLRVTFFWPFFGNYWILELGANYEYVVVGEPGRKYLWILSRTPQMSDAQYRDITSRLAAKGYDANQLLRVKQTGH